MLDSRAEVFTDYNSHFQRITVAQLPNYGRCLFIDGDLQSAQLDQEVYHSALVKPAFRYNSSIKTALILDGGEGSTAKHILRYPQVETVTMVDIDCEVIETSKTYLPEWCEGAFTDPRFNIYYQDTGKFVREDSNQYDLIVWDLVDPHTYERDKLTPASSLYTLDFFASLRNRLAHNKGLLSIEYGYRNRYLMPELLKGMIRANRRDLFIQSFEEMWIFALFSKQLTQSHHDKIGSNL